MAKRVQLLLTFYILSLFNFPVNATPNAEKTLPILPFPEWSPLCCLTSRGCAAVDLVKYCPPCPDYCKEMEKCDCYFPGTKEIIRRRPTDQTPRPPFCPKCPKQSCRPCPAPKECTLENARAFIAL